MSKHEKDVMVVLPNARDKRNLTKMISEEYKLHWMDDEDFDYPHPKENFDLRTYTEKCSAYIRDNHIDAIFYSHDLANIVAGVLCERHNILGPTLESMFVSNHKYYSRANQPDPIWFDYIDLETGQWGNLEPRYPCYIKPPSLTMTLYQYRIDNAEDMDYAINMLRKDLPPVTKLFTDFFGEYVDLKKYPLANKNIIVVEDLVEEEDQHCVEGWFDPEGNIQLWEVSDHFYYPGKRKSVDVYVTPSVLPEETKEQLIEYAKQCVKQHGINAGFWNVEIWRKGDWISATEINGRSASVWYDLYYRTFNKSLSRAMVYLCCGEGEKTYNESPQRLKGDRFGTQFHVITYGEGKAEDFLDFDFIDTIEDTNVEIFTPKGSQIRQSRTTGVWLARFELFGSDFVQMCERADYLREKMLKQPELSPKPPQRKAIT